VVVSKPGNMRRKKKKKIKTRNALRLLRETQKQRGLGVEVL
jgi:hypothetical protein